MRIGVFGGSFDPIHWGHITLAECCQQQAELDRVWFIPAAQQPLKPAGPIASNADRMAMLELALAAYPAFEISTLELDRGGTSYTVDTLVAINSRMPAAQLFLLLGADSLVDFPRWRQPADICRLATLLVVNRGGAPRPNFAHLRQIIAPERVVEIEAAQVEMPPMQHSSSDIRQRIATGGDWQSLVPPGVADYIRDRRLYQ